MDYTKHYENFTEIIMESFLLTQYSNKKLSDGKPRNCQKK